MSALSSEIIEFQHQKITAQEPGKKIIIVSLIKLDNYYFKITIFQVK